MAERGAEIAIGRHALRAMGPLSAPLRYIPFLSWQGEEKTPRRRCTRRIFKACCYERKQSAKGRWKRACA